MSCVIETKYTHLMTCWIAQLLEILHTYTRAQCKHTNICIWYAIQSRRSLLYYNLVSARCPALRHLNSAVFHNMSTVIISTMIGYSSHKHIHLSLFVEIYSSRDLRSPRHYIHLITEQISRAPSVIYSGAIESNHKCVSESSNLFKSGFVSLL